jgi:serine protease Do
MFFRAVPLNVPAYGAATSSSASLAYAWVRRASFGIRWRPRGATSDVEIEIVRSGKRIQVRADVALMPKEPVANKEGPSMNAAGRAGLRLVPLDSVARKRFDVPHTTESGLVVTNVESGSPAAEAGILPGDVIIELNRRPLTHVEQFSEVWNAAKGPIALLVARRVHEFYVALEAKNQAQ